MKIAVIAVLASISAPAFAQENPTNLINKTLGLTVLEAMNIGNSLRMMSDHPEVGPDGRPSGRTITSQFRFDGAVLMAMAINIGEADKAQKAAQDVTRVLFSRYAVEIKNKDGVVDRRVPPEKQDEYQAEYDKAFASQAAVNMVRIKEADLCLAMKPVPPCTVTNSIPPGYLATLLKIIDR